MSLPPITTVKFSYTGTNNVPSYFDIEFLDAQFRGLIGSSSYDAWCADRDTPINPPAGTPTGGSFQITLQAKVYSIYELGVNSSIFPILKIENPQNLDVVNWLFNQNFSAPGNGYTFGEVQAAAWELLGDPYAGSTSIGTVDPAKVTALINLALANGNNYQSDITDSDPTNDYTLLLLAPYRTNGAAQQPTLVQVKSAALGDFVWHDTNANGIQDTSEVGIAGAVVKLVRDLNDDGDFDDLNEVLAQTTTGAQGEYKFTGLTPGLDYQVLFMTPNGYDATSPRQSDSLPLSGVNSDGLVSDKVILSAGEYNQTIDAGFYKLAELGDQVWLDGNGNGQQDNQEAGVADVTVKLLDSTGTVIRTTVTDGNGFYLFDNLNPGTYSVEFVAPTGFLFTNNDIGSDTTDSDANTTNGKTGSYSLLSGDSDLTVDAGLIAEIIPAQLGDRVWEDKNANGQQDAGENGISGATVRLYTCVNNTKGVLVGTTTTDGAGNYNFANLIPGDYIVEFVTPDGYTSTVANVGGDASDSDNVGGLSGCYTLQPGQNETTVDAGFYKTASLGDYVWVDSNADGIQNDGQTGLNGVTVNLLDGSGAVIATQVTANDTNGNPGYYLFSNLVPGTYAVEFVKPAGYEFTSRDQGANDGTDSDANATTGRTITTTLESGENDLTWDAGVVLQKASIGDRVWEDKNANGQQDAGENGISGATVRLYTCVNNTKGVLVGTTTTDGAGNYNFANLIPGDYIVEFVTPDGYTSTVANVGGDASDSDNVGGLSGCYTLQPGQNETTVDAGFYKTASLGDYVWVDSNADGIQNDGQTGLNGVTVNLLDGSGAVIATQVTANDGNGNPGYYLFSNLVPGTYAVEFVKPAGYEFTSRDQGANDGTDSDTNATTGRTITTTLESGENDLTWDAGLKTKASVCLTYNFDGNSATDGTDGNSRSYTVDGVTVNASAWSRDKTNGTWSKAFLGAYSGGHGVTDNSEGSGTGNTHTVDNVGHDNYVVYQFSQNVTVDKAFLGYVSGDSDIQIWIGSTSTPITSMSNTVLSNLGFTEINSTTSTTTRWADVNANNLSGNVLVIAADTTDTSPEDFFKIQQLAVCTDETQQGGKASIGNRVWCDTDGNGIQNSGELGVAGVTVKLLNSSGAVVASTTTNTDGIYNFTNLNPGDYKVQVVKPTGYNGFTLANQGGDDTIDSDVDSSGVSALTTLVAGENDTSWDAGFAPNKLTVTYDFNGNSYTDGTDGNSRSYTVNGVTATATAWSRDKVYGTWSKAFLGAYGGGHGVTDSSEGDGSSNKHTVDNVGGRDNYVVYQFSQKVTVDKAFLGYVSGDSDIQIWIGSTSTPITSMSNTVLSNLGFTEINSTTLTTTRWADINANNLSGNVLVIAADTTDTTPEDYFKIQNLTVSTNDPFLTPIALDLDGDGVETAALSSSSGSFDLMGNGQAIQSGWLSGDDGFLAADLNNNGRIDDISELFGGTAKGAGFEQLAKFDSNADRVINSSDAQFNQLIVWQDSNENHQTDANELLSLVDVGIISFDLNYSDSAHMDAQGNIHMENSHATLTNGSSIQMTDVYFNVSAADAATAGIDLYNAVADSSATDALLIGVNTGSVL